MRHESGITTVGRLLLLVLLALAVVVPPHSLAHAQLASGDGGAVVAEAGVGGNEIARWWGALGAALCGAEVRLILRAPAIGMNPYAIAAGLGGCLLAAMDVITTE